MIQKELALKVTDIVRQAGTRMRQECSVQIRTKEGHANFVTDIDVSIQNELLEKLQNVLPGAAFIAEEKDNRVPGGLTWIIDPIDGTQNFINGYQHSAISVALVSEGEGCLGVVYDPYLQEMFWAVRGGGAFINDRPIQVSERPLEQGLVILGTSPYRRDLAKQTFSAAEAIFQRCGDIRRSGSAALDLSYLAAGRCEGFFEMVLSPWDYAAASVLIREAGGTIDAIAPDAWGYDKPIGIVAGNQKSFQALKHMVDVHKQEENDGKF